MTSRDQAIAAYWNHLSLPERAQAMAGIRGTRSYRLTADHRRSFSRLPSWIRQDAVQAYSYATSPNVIYRDRMPPVPA